MGKFQEEIFPAQRMSATECLSHRWLQRRKQVSDVTPSSNPIPQSNELDLQRDTLRNLVDRWNNETNIALVVNNDEKRDQVVDICNINGIANEQSKLESGVMREITNLHPNDEQNKLTLKIEEIKNAEEVHSPSPVPKKQLKLENELLPIQCVDQPMMLNQFLKPLSNGVATMDTLDSKYAELENKHTKNIGRKTSKSPTPLSHVRKTSKSPTSLSPAASTLEIHDRKMSKSPTPSSSIPNCPDAYDGKYSKSPSPVRFIAGSVGGNGRNVSKSPTPLSSTPNSPDAYDGKYSKSPSPISFIAGSVGENGRSVSKSLTLNPAASTLEIHNRNTSKSPTPLSSIPNSPDAYDEKYSKSPSPISFIAGSVGEKGQRVSKSPTLNPAASILEKHDRKTSKSPTPQSSVPSSTGEYDGKISKSPSPLSFATNNVAENSRNVSRSPTTLSLFASTLEEYDRRTSKSPTPLNSLPSSPGEYGKISKSPSPLSFATNNAAENSKNVFKSSTPLRPVASTFGVYDRKITPSSSVPTSPEEYDGEISKSSTSTFVPINAKENYRNVSKSPTPLSPGTSTPEERDRKMSKSPTFQSSVASNLGQHDTKVSKSPTALNSAAKTLGENEKKISKSSTPQISIHGTPNRKISKSSTLQNYLYNSSAENNIKTSKSPSPLPSFTNKFGEYVRKTSKSPTAQSSAASSPSAHEELMFSISSNSSSDSISTASESGTNQKAIDTKKYSNDTARELLKSESNVSKAKSCDNTKEPSNSNATRQTAPKIVNSSPSPPPQCSSAEENKPISNSSDKPNDIPNRDNTALRTPTVEISDEFYECVKKRRFVIKSVQSRETHESIKNLQHDKPSSSRASPSRRSPLPADEEQFRTQRKTDDFAPPSELMKRRISDISTFLKSDRLTADQSISEEMSSFCNRLNRIVRLRHDSYSIDSDSMSSKRPKFRLSYFSRDVPLATTPPYHADLLNYLPLCDEAIATPVWSFQKTNPFHSDPSSLRNSPERFATPSLTKKILSKFFNDSLEYDISSTPSTSNGLPKDKITGIIS